MMMRRCQKNLNQKTVKRRRLQTKIRIISQQLKTGTKTRNAIRSAKTGIEKEGHERFTKTEEGPLKRKRRKKKTKQSKTGKDHRNCCKNMHARTIETVQNDRKIAKIEGRYS